MRRQLATAIVVLAGSLSGCGGDEPAVMPDVTERRLDVALSDIERAGFGDEVEVLGGGTFGIVDESNWTVCDQEPGSGQDIGSAPRLTVDRSCDSGDGLDPQATDEAPEKSAAPDAEEPVAEPAAKATQDAPAPTADEETFAMPNLVGMVLQDAQDTLQREGSYVLTQTDASGLERFQVNDSNWKVCTQSPNAGSDVPLSELVDLGVVKLDERCP